MNYTNVLYGMAYANAKEPYKRDYILQKRPIIWKSLLIRVTFYELHERAVWNGYTADLFELVLGCHIYVMCVRLHECVLYEILGWLRLVGSLKS